MENFNSPVDETVSTLDIEPFDYTSHFGSWKIKIFIQSIIERNGMHEVAIYSRHGGGTWRVTPSTPRRRA